MDQGEKIQEILVGQAEIKQQLNRIESDIESEKETRRRRNENIDIRLRAIEDWKNNLQGRLIVTLVIGGAAWSLVVAFIFWILNKNK